ncbi:hypothetical protein ACSNOK_27470 [Streptomyces sp. URMC 126]|uniref:hypothetical protein n=1 Tax=Streptomyces sp. URMC 126 TaxID=3423401 RepID=UPI003F1A8C06
MPAPDEPIVDIVARVESGRSNRMRGAIEDVTAWTVGDFGYSDHRSTTRRRGGSDAAREWRGHLRREPALVRVNRPSPGGTTLIRVERPSSASTGHRAGPSGAVLPSRGQGERLFVRVRFMGAFLDTRHIKEFPRRSRDDKRHENNEDEPAKTKTPQRIRLADIPVFRASAVAGK